MSDQDKKLEKYRQKRDFRRTTEPQGSQSSSQKPIFVVQKHDASNLHYDFRLEIDGVLKSWAVPKGPSLHTKDSRLALPTEDHPLEYANFEGTVPEGEYGAGTVMIWDKGTYHNLRADIEDESLTMSESYDAGKIEVWLEGQKLKGGFALIRTGAGDDVRWLLIKMDDEKANGRRNLTSTEPESVESGRSLDEIEAKS